MPKDFRGGSTIEELEARKKQALEDIRKMEAEINRLKAEKAQDRQIDLAGLCHSVGSLIKTSSSSFSEIYIGEVIEYAYEQGHRCADSYSRAIDVEISGRVREEDGAICATSPADLKRLSMMNEDPTLVVSYLIPYDLVKKEPFFKKWAE